MNQFQREMRQLAKNLDEMEKMLDRTFKAYNPDEARDQAGKWTGGVGGGSTGDTADRIRDKKKKLSEAFDRASKPTSADQFARDVRGINSGSFTGRGAMSRNRK